MGNETRSGRLQESEEEDGYRTFRLDLVGIVVGDMRASLEFYRRLGLEVAEEDHVEAVTEGGLRVAWDTAELIRQIDPSLTQPGGGHRVTLAFRCPTPAGVDAKNVELAALGHGHEEPWDAFWGQRYAVVKDPDGNPVDLFALGTAPGPRGRPCPARCASRE